MSFFANDLSCFLRDITSYDFFKKILRLSQTVRVLKLTRRKQNYFSWVIAASVKSLLKFLAYILITIMQQGEKKTSSQFINKLSMRSM